MDGFLDKPIGISSNSALQKVRKILTFVRQVMLVL